MGTGSKILFIEDETGEDNNIIGALEAANLITGDIDDRNALNDETNGNIVIATSFTDAFERIISLGDGSEYEWIFIDRNLGCYHDINSSIQIDKTEFTPEFFKGLNGFAGDYLFITLANAGVSLEKICFLTANTDSSIEAVEKSPYMHKSRLPRIIDKTPDGYGELKKILKDSHGAKIRFLYRDIFNNIKVKDIFSPYIEEFITILAKRYKYGSNAKYNKGDGILLRNMIEAVVRDIAKTHFPNDPDLSCRDVLNDKNSGYNLQYDKFVLKNWWHYFDLYKRLPDNNDQTKIENDLKKQYPKYYNKDPKQAQKQAQKIIACSYEIKTLTALQLIFRNQSQYVDLPKYIFSYIDNIYTITSEFSAHGRNDKTTDAEGFSPDGWSALLSGMLQIMQWVADKNPNPPSYQN